MPATGPKNISEAQIIAAMKKHAAIPALMANELGCDRTNITRRIQRSVALQEAEREVIEGIKDVAQGVVVATLLMRDITGKPSKEAQSMAKWKMDYDLRNDGFKVRMEHSGPNGSAIPVAPVQVVITYVDADGDVI